MKSLHRGKAGPSKTKKKQSKTIQARARTSGENPGSPNEKPTRKGQFTKNDPRINRTIPGPGRPRGKFARKCRKILNNPNTWRAVRRTLKNENNPQFKGMWSEVTNRGYGKVQSEVALSLPQGGEDEEGNKIDATFLLIGKIDAMAKRKEKAEGRSK